MKRFYYGHKKVAFKPILAVALFLVVFCLFISGISNVSSKTSADQTELLHQAISRGVTHCYATEGHYPENLDYLRTHYGITYDEETYFVDYKVLGKNIFPDITIIEK